VRVVSDGRSDDRAVYRLLAAVRPRRLVQYRRPQSSGDAIRGRTARDVGQGVGHLEPDRLRSEAPSLSLDARRVPAGEYQSLLLSTL